LFQVLRRAVQVSADHPAVKESADTSKRKTLKSKPKAKGKAKSKK
jgi:hypothetical protein